MIVGGYALDLYCDNPECKHVPREGPAGEFTGESGATCRAEARKAGWTLNYREGTCKCPHCSKKRPSAVSEGESNG